MKTTDFILCLVALWTVLLFLAFTGGAVWTLCIFAIGRRMGRREKR